MMRRLRWWGWSAAAASLVVLAACSDPPEPDPTSGAGDPTATATGEDPQTSPPQHSEGVSEPSETASSGPPDGLQDPDVIPPAAALALVPTDADVVTMTNYAAIKTRLGVADLTSESIATDRIEFWQLVPVQAVLLVEPLLRPDNSLFEQRYHLTQDDALWEVRWAGDLEPQSGFALQLRPDVDLAGLQQAVDDNVEAVAGAELVGDTLLRAPTTTTTWAADPVMASVVDPADESTYLQRGCVPFLEALGPDADSQVQDEILAEHDVTALIPIRGFAVGFVGGQAEVRLAYPADASAAEIETDLQARVDLAADWPSTDLMGFGEGFSAADGAVDEVVPPVGTIGYPVSNPVAAAGVTLAQALPMAVCSDVELLPEPTG